MQISTPLAGELTQYLDLSDAQLKITAQNMANVDTPGYRTLGFDFAAEMGRAAADSGWGRRGPTKEGGPASPHMGKVEGLLERPDGNNVSMDREGLKMAEAQLEFRTAVELLKHEFSRVANAIHEDK
jgi:flagellar basal-body rod protein FlgB